MDGGAWWAAVHGVAKSRSQLSDFTFTFHFPALEKEMSTHSSVLAWRIPGTGKPGGLPSMGSQRVGHDWSDLAAVAAAVHWLIFLGWTTLHSWDKPNLVMMYRTFDMLLYSVSQYFSSLQLLNHVRLFVTLDCSMPDFPLHHQLLEFTQTHVHRMGNAIQPSHPLTPSPLAFSISQHQGLF